MSLQTCALLFPVLAWSCASELSNRLGGGGRVADVKREKGQKLMRLCSFVRNKAGLEMEPRKKHRPVCR